jgi:Rrf2 family nitric oxide-sensitive transcriptional repressor
MRLNRFTDYAVRVLMTAAARAPQRVTVDEVSRLFGISRHHLTRVVHRLGQMGYLATVRGVGGGFTLGQPADRIRLGRVVRQCEGHASVIDCMDDPGRPCCLLPGCRLKHALDEGAEAFFETLDRYTLADLVVSTTAATLRRTVPEAPAPRRQQASRRRTTPAQKGSGSR